MEIKKASPAAMASSSDKQHLDDDKVIIIILNRCSIDSHSYDNAYLYTGWLIRSATRAHGHLHHQLLEHEELHALLRTQQHRI